MTSELNEEQLYHRALHLYQYAGLAEGKRVHQKLRRLAAGSLYDAILTGLAWAVEERWEEALVAYDRALGLGVDPHMAVFALKSDALARLSRYDDAIATCDAGIALAPGNLPLYEIKAVFLLAFDRIAEVVNVYDAILQVRPRSVEVLLFKSLAFYLLGDTQQARCVQEQLQAILPDPSKIPAFKENVRSHLMQYERLVDSYLADNLMQADAWYCKGLIAQMRWGPAGSLDEALAAFEKAVDLDPSHAWAWNGKGIVLLEQRMYREAAVAFAQATRLLPGVEGFARNRKKAVRAAEGSVSSRPYPGKSKKGKKAKGRKQRRYTQLEIPPPELLDQLMEEERFDEALVACEQLLSVARKGLGGLDLEAALWLKARILLDLERPAEAVETYWELLRHNPAHPHARDELAEVLFTEQRYAEALDAVCVDAVLQAGGEGLREKRAALLLMLGRYQEALQCAQRARELAPTNSMAYLIIATALRELGRNVEALHLCEEALIAVDQDSRTIPMLYLFKADTLLVLGRPREALPVYEEALRREMEIREQQIDNETGVLLEGLLGGQPFGDATALMYGGMGNAWLLLGNGAEALEYYDRALSLGPDVEIEENRKRALLLLHQTASRLSNAVPAGFAVLVPSQGGQAELTARAGNRAWVLVERAAFAAGALLAVGLLFAPLSGFDLGHLFHAFPARLVEVIEVVVCLLYPVSCWFGWASPPNGMVTERTASGTSQPPGYGLQCARKAAFTGGAYLVLTAGILLAVGANRGFPPTEPITPVMLAVWAILLLLHLAAWLALTNRKAARGQSRPGR